MQDREDEELIVTVPLVDEQEGRRIYAPSLLRLAGLGALVGGLVLGLLGYALAAGLLTLAGLGQWAAAGVGPATVAGAGIGVAIGGLAGALLALRNLPP